MSRPLFALVVLLAALPTFAGDAAAPPNNIQQAKILEWGWHTPPPTYVREHIREMEKMPFDGIVLDLTWNGMHDLTQKVARQHTFPAGSFGGDPLDRANYSESIEALAHTKFEKFTDNFLRMNVTPGNQDWFDDAHFAAAANAATLAAIVKECHLKGIVLDTETYASDIFNSKLQPQTKEHTLAEYRRQVRKRGRQFMRAINNVDPKTTLLITLAYSMAHFHDGNAQKYQLLPDFLDGILDQAAPGQVIYDGWEWAYNFKTEKQFARTRRIIRAKSPRLDRRPQCHEGALAGQLRPLARLQRPLGPPRFLQKLLHPRPVRLFRPRRAQIYRPLRLDLVPGPQLVGRLHAPGLHRCPPPGPAEKPAPSAPKSPILPRFARPFPNRRNLLTMRGSTKTAGSPCVACRTGGGGYSQLRKIMAEQDQDTGAPVATEEEQEFTYPIKIEEAGPATKRVSVEIPQERIASKLEEQFKELRQQAAIPGFRVGHAPQKLIEKRFSSDVKEQVRRAPDLRELRAGGREE